MKENVVNELIARRFLLGDLPVDERERMEELAFQDPETFALMQSAQDDLIDDFVNDELSSEERERFQNYFLAQPGRRQDLRIARALQQYLGREEPSVQNVATNVVVPQPQPRPSIFDWLKLRPATVSLMVLFLVAVGIFVTRPTDDSRLAQQGPTPALPSPSSSPVETPVQSSPSPTAEIQNTPAPSPRHPVEAIYAVVLVPGGPARSEGEETKVRPVSTPISFELPVVDNIPYQHYQALLQRNGNTIRTWSNLQTRELQSGRALKIEVPAGLLERRRYRILVMGRNADGKDQPVHTYYFHVSN